MKKILALLSLSACVSAAPVPLQSCTNVLEAFQPVGCQPLSKTTLVCANAKGKYLLVSQQTAQFSKNAEQEGFVQTGPVVQCQVEGAEYEATFWKVGKPTAKNERPLDYKTL